MNTGRNLHVFADVEALHHAAAEHFIEAAAVSVREFGRCTVALAGGATPNGLYALLATKPYRSRVDWRDLHVFWGDERCVPPDDPRSNYRGAFELLLSRVPVPPANVHRMRGELEPSDAAVLYERGLREHFATPSGAPLFRGGARFDLVLLGLGTDGHTASLFPGSTVLSERTRWATAAYAASAGMWRITLTPVLMNAAARVHFLVAGSEKRDIVRQLVTRMPWTSSARDARTTNAPDPAGTGYPAEQIVPPEGELLWSIDAAAAAATAR